MAPDLDAADGDHESDGRRIRPAGVVVLGWLRATAGLLALAGCVAGAVAVAWPPARSPAFAGWVGLALLAVVVATGVALERSARSGSSGPLTLATWITLARGAALATFVGVLAVGGLESTTAAGAVAVPTGGVAPAAWLPAVLFAAVGLLDAVDGAVARARGETTTLGGRLDAEVDGLTTLVGSIGAVAAGAAPVAFLLVGAARYLYVGSRWVRRRLGRPVGDLPSSRVRGPLSAAVLLAIWVALAPVATAGQSALLATVVAAPFLANFLRDWLVVTGRRSR